MNKLIDAVNRYRGVCSIIESCSVDGIGVGDGLKTEKHDAYVNMLNVCDEAMSFKQEVIFEVGLSDNGKLIRSVEFQISHDTARVKIWISREMVDSAHGMCRGISHYYIEGVCAQCGSKEKI